MVKKSRRVAELIASRMESIRRNSKDIDRATRWNSVEPRNSSRTVGSGKNRKVIS